MSTSGLSPEQIALLLKEESQQQSTTRTRGKKVDPTEDRTVQGWFRLSHHMCMSDCPHRIDPRNPTAELKAPDASQLAKGASYEVVKVGSACWNPNCLDHTRSREKIHRVNIVYEVKGQNICRYCYLGGYLV